MPLELSAYLSLKAGEVGVRLKILEEGVVLAFIPLSQSGVNKRFSIRSRLSTVFPFAIRRTQKGSQFISRRIFGEL